MVLVQNSVPIFASVLEGKRRPYVLKMEAKSAYENPVLCPTDDSAFHPHGAEQNRRW
jgi:hypothetical protein